MQMKKTDRILENLRNDGFKITKVRSGIVEFFQHSGSPISASDLILTFAEKKIPVNKTTIYRELDFLLENGYIRGVEFGEGKKRYELANETHHHHLVCLKCKKTFDVELKINLKKEESRLEKANKFTIRNHNLEFFGYCSDCS